MPSSYFTCRPIASKALDLASPGTIRAVARRFGVRFERKWGQTFLADRDYLDRLVSQLELTAKDRVLEIGPGLGVLTRELAQKTSAVAAVEIDPACVRALGLTLRGLSSVRIIEGDILKVAPGELIGVGTAKPSAEGMDRSAPAMSDGDRSPARGSRLIASIRDPDSPEAGSRA